MHSVYFIPVDSVILVAKNITIMHNYVLVWMYDNKNTKVNK